MASSGWNAALNLGPGVVVTNAHLLASYLGQLGPRSFDLMIIDEAYQLAASDFLPIANLPKGSHGGRSRPARPRKRRRHQ